MCAVTSVFYPGTPHVHPTGRLALLAMPVLVTGAQTGLGRAVVARLRRAGGEIRVYVDEDAHDAAEAYRRSGVKAARGDLADEARLELALEQVHTLVHAGGDLLEEPEVMLDALASASSAAIGAGCRRLVWASHLGADEPGANPFFQACVEAEQLLADAPMETVVIRRALTYGPGDALTARLADGLPGVDVTARHAPLYLDDLAGAIVAADAERGRPGASQVRVTLSGPDVVTVRDLATALGAARGLQASRTPSVLPAHVVDVLSHDRLPGPGALGRSGTPLAEGVARLHAAEEQR